MYISHVPVRDDDSIDSVLLLYEHFLYWMIQGVIVVVQAVQCQQLLS